MTLAEQLARALQMVDAAMKQQPDVGLLTRLLEKNRALERQVGIQQEEIKALSLYAESLEQQIASRRWTP